ncbi:MAG TPA: hypothetical protein VJ043_02485 [Candidatus Paceibacterota bacterium]|nr:hypothetical protein [Candidatus Paceibacterota bacterium]
MGRLKKVVLIIIAAVGLGFGGMSAWFAQSVNGEEAARRFIAANPLDLSQIEAFSKYRSCMGHDFRAPNLSGEKEATPRSMKHYVMVKPEFHGTIDKVSAFAPFDGIISVVDDDLGGPGDQQVWLAPHSISPRQWHFVFFHINLKQGLEKGSRVKAGDLIGTANLRRGPDNVTGNFDIAVKFTRPLHRPAIDAPFNHATQDVLDEYSEYGVSANDLIISEKARDAVACQIDTNVDYGGPDVYFSRNTNAGDYIWLRN